MSVRDSLIVDWVRGGATVNEVVQQLQGLIKPESKGHAKRFFNVK